MFKKSPLAMLRVGAVLKAPIYDQQNRKLLGADVEITDELLVALYKRGVSSVILDAKDVERLTAFAATGVAKNTLPHRAVARSSLQSEATRLLDDQLSQIPTDEIEAAENPFFHQIQSHGACSYDPKRMNRFFDHHQQTAEQVGNLLARLAEGQSVATEALKKISQGVLMQAAEDMDLFVCLGINPTSSNSIMDHSTNVATLAVAIGGTLGLDEQSLLDLGTGCLVHNVGMLHIDEKVYLSKEVLDASQFVEIAKHPIIAADMLYDNTVRVPLGVRMIVYQMHERCDGSGYPKGLQGDRIHPLTKIAAVADAYVALVSKRPHRHAMLPYHAMAKMLKDVSTGLFDSVAVRGLLQTISLFPLGSFAELSGGQVAKVIRTSGPAYNRPIVEAWHRRRLSDQPAVIDLTMNDVRITKPLTRLQ